jgi:pimeloyl-ACP methyl ester carboxylesterase
VGIVAIGDSAAIGAVLADALGARATCLVIDDTIVLTPTERAALLRDGLPSYEPDTSGSHLLRLWDTARSRFLFRPDHMWTHANRLDRDMASPRELNEVLKAYLRAGSDYARAIRAVQDVDLATILEGLSIPVFIVNYPATPEHRRPVPPARGRERVVAPNDHDRTIGDFLASNPGDVAQEGAPATHAARPGDFSRLFMRASGPTGLGYVHALANFEGSGRPVLIVHDPAGSSALTTYYAQPMIGSRPVICPDLPGAGESDNIVGNAGVTPGDYAEAMHSALDALGLDEVDVIGRYSGGPIGMEMAFQRPGRVRHLVQAATAVYTENDVRDVLANYTPSIAPTRDGAHLNLAWYNMKNQALFWPWFRQTREGIIPGEPQMDPAMINQRVFDLLRTGDQYAHAYKAMWIYPMVEKLPRVTTPQLLCAPRWDPIYGLMAELKSLAPQPQTEIATLPDSFADWGGVFMAWFDRTP